MSDNCFDNVGDVTYIDLRQADLTDLEKREKDLEERHAKLEDEFKKMKKDINILSNNPLLCPKDDSKCQIPTFKILLPNIPIENQEDILGYINVASNGDDYKNYFAMSVIKNSLEPRLQVGDIIIVRKATKTQIKNGDLVVFSAKGKKKTEVNVRLIKYLDNGINFAGINPRAEAFFFSDEDIEELSVQIIGKVEQGIIQF